MYITEIIKNGYDSSFKIPIGSKILNARFTFGDQICFTISSEFAYYEGSNYDIIINYVLVSHPNNFNISNDYEYFDTLKNISNDETINQHLFIEEIKPLSVIRDEKIENIIT